MKLIEAITDCPSLIVIIITGIIYAMLFIDALMGFPILSALYSRKQKEIKKSENIKLINENIQRIKDAIK